MKLNWDSLGIATSIACAVHCALLPLILTGLPLFGINILHNLAFEWGMILFAFLVGAYALLQGYRKHQKTFVPLRLFSAGFVMLLLKQAFPPYEFYFLVPAVGFIVTAHYFNYRVCRRTESTTPGHTH